MLLLNGAGLTIINRILLQKVVSIYLLVYHIAPLPVLAIPIFFALILGVFYLAGAILGHLYGKLKTRNKPNVNGNIP